MVVFQLHHVLEKEEPSLDEVVRVIERDPALTVRLLRSANAAAWGSGTEIRTIKEAAGVLGLPEIRALSLVNAAVQAFANGGQSLDHRRFWEHSTAVALVANWLQGGMAPPDDPDEDPYVAGLLHDVGHLILDQFFPDAFGQISLQTRDRGDPAWQVEEEQLGLDHGEVGGLLLGRWDLPRSIVDAVTCHHHPDAAPRKHTRLSLIVWGAEALCSAAGLHLPHEGAAAIRPSAVLARLDMPQDEEEVVLYEVCRIGERAREMMQVPENVATSSLSA